MDTKKGEWPLGETTSKKAPKLSLVDGSTDIRFQRFGESQEGASKGTEKVSQEVKTVLKAPVAKKNSLSFTK